VSENGIPNTWHIFAGENEKITTMASHLPLKMILTGHEILQPNTSKYTIHIPIIKYHETGILMIRECVFVDF